MERAALLAQQKRMEERREINTVLLTPDREQKVSSNYLEQSKYLHVIPDIKNGTFDK